MIRFIYSKEKTNAYRPTPWHYSTDPFPAFRGDSHSYSAFLAISSNYEPDIDGNPKGPGYYDAVIATDRKYSRLIKTRKGTNLIIPCSKEEDEKILLLTLRGGFRGYYSRIEQVGCEIIYDKGGKKHTVETHHIVARITKESGFVYAETGRRSGTGIVEIFSWEGYKLMSTEEFEAWFELNSARGLTSPRCN